MDKQLIIGPNRGNLFITCPKLQGLFGSFDYYIYFCTINYCLTLKFETMESKNSLPSVTPVESESGYDAILQCAVALLSWSHNTD